MSQLHYGTCTLCEATCGIVIETQAQQILTIRGDNQDPFSRGYICPKATALKSLHYDPDRLRTPLIRDGRTWREITWRQALDFAARGIHDIQMRHGHNAVGVYLGNPTVHNLGAMMFMPQLVRTLKSKNRFSATSVDQLPHQFVSYLMFGHQLLVPIPDLDRMDYLVILGANPLASNGSLMTAPDIKNRLLAIKKRGGLVVLDPRYTETAALASAHYFIKPETDAVFLLAVLNTIIEAKLYNLRHLQNQINGWEELKAVACLYTAEQAAALTGVAAKDIRELSHKLAKTERAAIYGRIGVSTQSYGALCQWLINVINIVCGHLDRVGGVMFTTPALDAIGAAGSIAIGRGSIGRWKSQVRGLPEFAGELPVATLAEEILLAGDQRIRAMITIAGNPVLSTPNGKQMDKAYASLDFAVAIDMYLNETSRHANVILPPCSPLERSHYDLAFNLLAIRNTAKYSPAIFAKPQKAKHDWQIALGLMKRLEILRGANLIKTKAKYAALSAIGPEGFLAIGLQMGPYGLKNGWPAKVSLGKLKKNPHGIDLGPLQPQLPSRLMTKDKRLELAPELLLQDLQRLKTNMAHGEQKLLRLIGRRHIRSNNSWLHNAAPLMTGKPRWHLWMAQSDGQRLGLSQGQLVKVRSRTGEVQVPVHLTDQIMPGVVSLPHGFGHNRSGTRLSVASQHAGVSINDLTDDQRVDALCGNAALNGVSVEVTAVDAHESPP